MRRWVFLNIYVMLLSGILACFRVGGSLAEAQGLAKNVPPTANPEVLLKTTKGQMLVELFPKNAPDVVSFFLEQAKKGNYNRLHFKRYADGFAIQLAEPGKVDNPVPADERNNGLNHVLGSVGLVWDYVKNTNGNKLYICLTTVSQLDNKHTVIGQVTEGLDVLSELRPGDKLERINLIKKHSSLKK